MKIIFTGGGTGGHTIPIVAISRELQRLAREKRADLRMYYLGPKDRFGVLVPQEGIKIFPVVSGKLRRYITFNSIIDDLIDIFKIPFGIIEAFFLLFFIAPDIVFSKGGYGSIPTIVAAWTLRVPIFLHESDVSPGLANKIISHFSAKIFVSFPPSQEEYFPKEKMIFVGNPIRKGLFNGSIDEAKQIFHLVGDKPVLLILGGSQGSRRINDKVLDGLPKFLENFEVIHQCGTNNFKEVRKEAMVVAPDDLAQYYHLFPFLNEKQLSDAYKVSSFIVSRAGSGSTFEIAALGKPSILIPLPEAAQNHQVKNAYAYASTGAAYVVEETNLTPNFLIERIKYILSHPDEVRKMSQAALKFAKPKAASIIAERILSFLMI